MKRIVAYVLLIQAFTTAPAFAKSVVASRGDVESAWIGFIFLVGCAAICGFAAKAKGRNPLGWVIAGLFLNVFAVIAVAIVTRGDGVSRNASADQQREVGEKLFAIQSGALKPFVPDGIMPQPGEQFYWEQQARYGQTFKEQKHRGSNPALYVPLCHGIRARVGGYSGSSQQMSHFAWGPTGKVYLSNLRLLFKADSGEIAQAPFAEILTYDAFSDGLGLNVNRIGVMQFKTGDECLGAAFVRLVKPPSNRPSSDDLAAKARELEEELTAKYADIVRDHDAGKITDAEFARVTAQVESMRSRAHVIEGDLPKP